MGIRESADYYEEYFYLDFAGVIDKMLADYSEDDLTELLCECEMLLQTNGIYLNKLNEHGFKKFLNFVSGIESRCNCRLRDNFQILHIITIKIIKKILSRFNDLTYLILKLREKQASDNSCMQYCINSLVQKIDDYRKAIATIDQKVNLINWELHTLNKYVSCSDTRKVLQVVSDIYAITGGSCEGGYEVLEPALKKLEVLNVEISPIEFAQEVMRDLECLPLYIKDEENYHDARTDISGYGSIIYQIRDLVIDQSIQELAAAQKESVDNLCAPLLKEWIEKNELCTTNASLIGWWLLEDMKKIHTRIMAGQKRIQEIEDKERRQREEREKARREAEASEQQKQQEEREKRRKYSLLLASPSNMLKCSLEGYMEDSFDPTNEYGLDEESMKYVKKEINSFSPAIIVKPDGMIDADMFMGDDKILTVSLADFFFCLWYKSQKRDKNIRAIALLDYYKKNLYVSCYKIDGTDKISKKVPFTIKYSKTRKHIMDAIKDNTKEEFFKGIPDQEISLFRIFESDKYIDKKLEKVDASFIGKMWRVLFESREGREDVFRYFYDFKREVLLSR